MTRRESIVVLLENYRDVINGLRDQASDGVHIPLMCRSWNFPQAGYPELERLLRKMRLAEKSLYWAVAQTYFWSQERVVLVCPHCFDVLHRRSEWYDPWTPDSVVHRHGGKPVSLVYRKIRIAPNINSKLVDCERKDSDRCGHCAVDWLDEHWRGSPFVPDDVMKTLERGHLKEGAEMGTAVA